MNELAINKFNSIGEDQISLSKANKISEKQKDTLAHFDNAKLGWKHVSFYSLVFMQLFHPFPTDSNKETVKVMVRDRKGWGSEFSLFLFVFILILEFLKVKTCLIAGIGFFTVNHY